jgi:hypothetical protein
MDEARRVASNSGRKKIMIRTISLVIFAALAGCGFYSNAPGIGEGDYWIEQRSSLSPNRWDKVALVFGYGEQDELMCSDFVEAMG